MKKYEHWTTEDLLKHARTIRERGGAVTRELQTVIDNRLRAESHARTWGLPHPPAPKEN